MTLLPGRVRDMKDADHLKMLGIEVDDVRFNRQAIADHAANLASTIRGNLTRSMESMGVDILIGNGKLMDAHTVSYGYPGKPGGKCTAANVIIATGSTPFVPPGIEIDNKVRPARCLSHVIHNATICWMTWESYLPMTSDDLASNI